MRLRWLSDLGVVALHFVQWLFFLLIGSVAMLMRGLDNWFDRQANRNRLFRRLLLVWACGLITWVVWVSFTKPPDIPGSTAAAITGVLGLLTVVIGFYQWSRASEDAKARQKDGDRPS